MSKIKIGQIWNWLGKEATPFGTLPGEPFIIRNIESEIVELQSIINNSTRRYIQIKELSNLCFQGNNSAQENEKSSIFKNLKTSLRNIGWSSNLSQTPEISEVKQTIYSETVICQCCKVPSDYAQPNQTDGSFICYGCRNGW